MSCSRITVIAMSLTLGAFGSLCSWSQPVEPVHLREAPSERPSFPLDPGQEWYVKESYLLWHPSEDDVDWGNRIGFNIGSEIDLSVRVKQPDFGWYSGVRLAAGRYLPKHDHWDVSLTATYFYANAEDQASPKMAKNGLLQTSWAVNDAPTAFNKGEATWRLNFLTWDLGLGRNAFLSSKITAHPFLALRAVLAYENIGSRCSFVEGKTPAVAGDFKFRFKGSNDFWGVGPRLGSDFTYYIKKCWTLLGSFSGSVLLGSYKVDENMSLYRSLRPITNKFTASDQGFAIRGNLEGSLGMGWEKWAYDHTVRIAPSFVVEAAQWYDMNQWMTLGNLAAGTPSNDQIGRRHGDLTLWGFNFNLQVDF